MNKEPLTCDITFTLFRKHARTHKHWSMLMHRNDENKDDQTDRCTDRNEQIIYHICTVWWRLVKVARDSGSKTEKSVYTLKRNSNKSFCKINIHLNNPTTVSGFNTFMCGWSWTQISNDADVRRERPPAKGSKINHSSVYHWLDTWIHFIPFGRQNVW